MCEEKNWWDVCKCNAHYQGECICWFEYLNDDSIPKVHDSHNKRGKE